MLQEQEKDAEPAQKLISAKRGYCPRGWKSKGEEVVVLEPRIGKKSLDLVFGPLGKAP